MNLFTMNLVPLALVAFMATSSGGVSTSTTARWGFTRRCSRCATGCIRRWSGCDSHKGEWNSTLTDVYGNCGQAYSACEAVGNQVCNDEGEAVTIGCSGEPTITATCSTCATGCIRGGGCDSHMWENGTLMITTTVVWRTAPVRW